MLVLAGYRHLPLYDASGEQYLFSTIFVKIEINPMKVIDREISQRTSTIENLKSTAKSVLSRSFSTDRRTSQRKAPLKEGTK